MNLEMIDFDKFRFAHDRLCHDKIGARDEKQEHDEFSHAPIVCERRCRATGPVARLPWR